MARRRDSETTIVISNLDKQEALSIAYSLNDVKRKVSGKAKASVVIGEKSIFERLMTKCNKQLGIDNK